jgi:hypothetical protein
MYTTTTNEVQLGGGIHLTTKPLERRRTVTEPLDWIEAYLSSVLPVWALKVQQATTLEEARTASTSLQQHITFALGATVIFRRAGTFSNALKYLESHRQECTGKANSNIAVPDTIKLTTLMHDAVSAAVRNANSNSSSSSSSESSSSAHNANNRRATKPSGNKPADGSCGLFNSHAGCTTTTCTYRHECRICKSSEHGKPKCPQFKPQFGKNSASGKTPPPKKK